ncbi:MAG: hypothetical protein ACK4E3_10505 [Brevundimonas sp.]|uniref:hypothetical protein n=1 Tax=Brevundimonas sp. TaxID=1871086 RepID=UPI00391B50A8
MSDPNATPNPNPSTPQGSLPGGDAPGGDPAPAAPEAAAPAAPEAAAPAPEGDPAAPGDDPRARVFESAEDYAITADDAVREKLGLKDDDPLAKGLREYAATSKKPQGFVDDVIDLVRDLSDRGVLDTGFDPQAELAALGERGPERRREAEIYVESLKDRGEISEGAYAELMSLTPTAAGVELLEYFRKARPAEGGGTTGGAATSDADKAREAAKAMAKDERYGKDRQFTLQADRAWAEAFGGRA